MTINDVPRDVIATGVVPHLPLADRNRLMRTSKACMAACQSDPVWLPMIRALFLMRERGKSAYQTVKNFYERFTNWSNRILVPPAPKGVFARIGGLFRSTPKEIPFETNVKRLQNPNIGQELVPGYLTFTQAVARNNIEVAFHLHQMVPGFLQTGELIARAMYEGHWPITLELSKLLLKTTEISEETREELVIAAAKNGNLQVVKELLENGTITNPLNIARAIAEAQGASQIEIISEIVKKVTMLPEPYTGARLEVQRFAMTQAIIANNLIAFRELLKLDPISLELAVECYEAAAYGLYVFKHIDQYVVMRVLEEKCPAVIEASANNIYCQRLLARDRFRAV